MARIQRTKPRKHLVVADTNILWHKDKAFVVNPDFDSFWDKHATTFGLKLVVPATVRGELLFQQTTSALKALAKATEGLQDAATVAATRYQHRVTESRVARDVERRFDRWLKRRKGQLVSVPFAKVAWHDMAEEAIWRKGPFAPDPKLPDGEEGFRDALILETVADIAGSPPADCQIAFLCNDNLLRSVAEKRLAGVACLSCYDSVADFSSYLRLSQEKLTKAFVQAIRSRAKAKFYTKDDPTCLYTAKALIADIKQRFPEAFGWHGEFDTPPLTPLLRTSLFASLSQNPEWTASSREAIWLGNPEFVRLDGERDFHWSSTITFVQVFRQQPTTTLLAITSGAEERLRILEFAVSWHSVVKADGRFQSFALDAISESDRSFAPATSEDLQRYRLAPASP